MNWVLLVLILNWKTNSKQNSFTNQMSLIQFLNWSNALANCSELECNSINWKEPTQNSDSFVNWVWVILILNWTAKRFNTLLTLLSNAVKRTDSFMINDTRSDSKLVNKSKLVYNSIHWKEPTQKSDSFLNRLPLILNWIANWSDTPCWFVWLIH